jgi:hypothetical protein
MKYILKLFSVHHLEIKMRYNQTILKLALQSHVYISLAGRPTFVANRAHVLEKKTKTEEKEEKLKKEAESSAWPCPQGCEDIRSASLSPSSYCSTIFSEIAPLSSSCAPNLVKAARDPCVSWCLRSSSAL